MSNAPDVEVIRPPAEVMRRKGLYLPSPELSVWVRNTFLRVGAPLFNKEHYHLAEFEAEIGFLWANEENSKNGQRTLGMAQVAKPSGDKWVAGQRWQQLEDWFHEIPDFLITLDAAWFAQASPLQCCAVIEHELYHCDMKRDQWGEPKMNPQNNMPTWAMRGHDVEEFVGVVERYGAWGEHLERLREALNAKPLHDMAKIEGICGCGRRIA